MVLDGGSGVHLRDSSFASLISDFESGREALEGGLGSTTHGRFVPLMSCR